MQMPLPNPPPTDANAMAEWLHAELKTDEPASRVRDEPAKPAAWGDKTMTQPARWSVTLGSPRMNMEAAYWVGNGFVSVKRRENNVFGRLTICTRVRASAWDGYCWPTSWAAPSSCFA